VISEDRVLMQRLEGHVQDISVALGEVTFALAALATIERFRVEAQTGLDPLAGTPYRELGFEDGDEEGLNDSSLGEE
jgi:hypothetical protein